MDINKGIEKLKQFFQEIKVEIKKITWPNRKETVASTIVVIVIVLIISVYLGLADAILTRAVNVILS